MAYKPKILEVGAGGTGAATLTGVLTGNGTSTITASAITQHNVLTAGASNAISSIAPGSSGNVLTSNGIDWTSAAVTSSGYVLSMRNTTSGNPADATTYFMGPQIFTSFTSSSQQSRIYIPRTGTITRCLLDIGVSGTLGSANNSTLNIRVNNTTDNLVSNALATTAAANVTDTTGLSISVTAGDYIEFKFTCPTWTTNPTGVIFGASIVIS